MCMLIWDLGKGQSVWIRMVKLYFQLAQYNSPTHCPWFHSAGKTNTLKKNLNVSSQWLCIHSCTCGVFPHCEAHSIRHFLPCQRNFIGEGGFIETPECFTFPYRTVIQQWINTKSHTSHTSNYRPAYLQFNTAWRTLYHIKTPLHLTACLLRPYALSYFPYLWGKADFQH